MLAKPALIAAASLFLFGPFLAIPNTAESQWGGTLRVALRAEPKTWNPITALDAPSREVLGRLHADLIHINRATQQTEPALAESWSRSKDGTRYTLHLRKGVTFSDGIPFTAADVVWTWNAYLDPALRSPQRDLLLIDGKPIEAVVVDAHTVEFKLPRPYAAAERLFDSVPILPRHLLEKAQKAGTLGASWPLDTNPAFMAGLGPFQLKQYKPGEAVLLERNPRYWKKAAQGRPLPYLDAIEFRLLATEELQLARFVSGSLDILNRLNRKSIAYLESQQAAVTDLGPSLEYNFLCFNLTPSAPKYAWFSKTEFRRALSLAADRAGIAKVVFSGRARPIWGHVSPGNRQWFAAPPSPPRSVPQARAELAKAGFSWNEAGRLVDAKGTPVEFSISVSTSSPERVEMASMLQADFEPLGIKVTTAPMEFRSLLNRVLDTRQFDTVLLGLGGGDADPNPEMNVWLSSGRMHLWNPSQPAPATAWEKEIDLLMRSQMAELNPKARHAAYARVQQIVADECPMILLVSPNVVVAAARTVGNFRPALLNHFTLWNAEELYLSNARPRP